MLEQKAPTWYYFRERSYLQNPFVNSKAACFQVTFWNTGLPNRCLVISKVQPECCSKAALFAFTFQGWFCKTSPSVLIRTGGSWPWLPMNIAWWAFKNCWCLGSIPRCSDLIGWGWVQALVFLISAPNDCTVQSGMRSTVLEHTGHSSHGW